MPVVLEYGDDLGVDDRELRYTVEVRVKGSVGNRKLVER